MDLEEIKIKNSKNNIIYLIYLPKKITYIFIANSFRMFYITFNLYFINQFILIINIIIKPIKIS